MSRLRSGGFKEQEPQERLTQQRTQGPPATTTIYPTKRKDIYQGNDDPQRKEGRPPLKGRSAKGKQGRAKATQEINRTRTRDTKTYERTCRTAASNSVTIGTSRQEQWRRWRKIPHERQEYIAHTVAPFSDTRDMKMQDHVKNIAHQGKTMTQEKRSRPTNAATVPR